MSLLAGTSSRRRTPCLLPNIRRREKASSIISITPPASPDTSGFGGSPPGPPYDDSPRYREANIHGSPRVGNSAHPREKFVERSNSPLNGFGATLDESKPSSVSPPSSLASHPWAHLVKPRRFRFEELTDDKVDSTLSLDIYKHVPGDGYLNEKYAVTLFPQLSTCDVLPEKLPFVELQTLEAAVDFRRDSQYIIDLVVHEDYLPRSYPEEKTPERTMPSVLAPPTINGRRPVLYQVVYVSNTKDELVLEAKDFFVILPDRLDLHCIVLNEQSFNVQSNTLGFDRRLVSIKDFVWVWTMEPTEESRKDSGGVLKRSRWPRMTAFDKRSAYFFRAAQFTFVSPAVLSEKVYGAILSIDGKWSSVQQKWDPIRGFKAAFEGAPEAVSLNQSVWKQSVCGFDVSRIHRGDLLIAESRRNVSCAIRFSEPAASPEAERQLCSLIKHFLPSHPDEGIMPITMNKLTPEDYEWFNDRLKKFVNYKLDPEAARKKMSKVFNMACSALEACRSLDDDKRIHRVAAEVVDITASPLRLRVVLSNMPREFGWAPGKPAIVWVKGAKAVSRVLVEKTSNKALSKELEVTLVARRCSHEHLARLVSEAAYFGIGRKRTVNVWVKLGKIHSSANSLYETVARMRLFDNLHTGLLGNTILDIVYGGKSASQSVGGHLVTTEELLGLRLTVGEKQIALTMEQRRAIRRGCAGYPIIAIPANFGSGKTLVACVIAALCKGERVILTGNSNEVVAKIANTFCSIETFKHITVLRYVSLGTSWKDRHSTPVDLDEVLKNLGEKFSEDIQSSPDRKTCTNFSERLSASLTAQEREKLELVETNVSPLLKDMVRIMFSVRFPDIICITTSSLLNAFSHNGIFAEHSDKFSLVICDKANQVPEPMFIAITNRLPSARQVYIGDPRQFSPHTRCNNSWTIGELGARSSLDILLGAERKAEPFPHDGDRKAKPALTKSFTIHPTLNQLARIVAYGEHLIDGADPGAQRLALDHLSFPHPSIPFLFVNVFRGESEIAESESSFNDREAEVCEQVVKRLLAKGLRRSDIVIVNFYKEQQRRLGSFAKNYDIENTTVEALQNRYCEIAILLTTKAEYDPPNGNFLYRRKAMSSEFLEEEERLVVALTRARQGLIVLGSYSFLRYAKHWKEIIKWAKGFGGVVSSSQLHRFLGGSVIQKVKADEMDDIDETDEAEW